MGLTQARSPAQYNSNVQFTFQTFGVNDDLGLTTAFGTSGKLTLATPTALTTLNVLDTDGNGAATFTATLNFSNNTSVSLGSQTAYDNFVPGTPNTTALEGMGRVSHTNYLDNSDFFNTPGTPCFTRTTLPFRPPTKTC